MKVKKEIETAFDTIVKNPELKEVSKNLDFLFKKLKLDMTDYNKGLLDGFYFAIKLHYTSSPQVISAASHLSLVLILASLKVADSIEDEENEQN